MKRKIQEEIEQCIGEKITESITENGLVQTASGRTCFFKSGGPSGTYLCEANGLHELKKSEAIRVADVISVGENYLLTEYIGSGTPSIRFFERFARQLAQMHRHQHTTFGFYEDNFIGVTPQHNTPTDAEKNDWSAFYFNKRLLFQYQLAERDKCVSPSLKAGFSQLESRIPSILSGSEEPPTLLHGDLWAGNFLCTPQNEAVLIDPAVYYGHRESDLAMTKLFGGFPPAFYRAYHEAYPLPEGWEYRENLYKLYHILNHLNLFGRGYLARAEYIVTVYTR